MSGINTPPDRDRDPRLLRASAQSLVDTMREFTTELRTTQIGLRDTERRADDEARRRRIGFAVIALVVALLFLGWLDNRNLSRDNRSLSRQIEAEQQANRRVLIDAQVAQCETDLRTLARLRSFLVDETGAGGLLDGDTRRQVADRYDEFFPFVDCAALRRRLEADLTGPAG